MNKNSARSGDVMFHAMAIFASLVWFAYAFLFTQDDESRLEFWLNVILLPLVYLGVLVLSKTVRVLRKPKKQRSDRDKGLLSILVVIIALHLLYGLVYLIRERSL